MTHKARAVRKGRRDKKKSTDLCVDEVDVGGVEVLAHQLAVLAELDEVLALHLDRFLFVVVWDVGGGRCVSYHSLHSRQGSRKVYTAASARKKQAYQPLLTAPRPKLANA